ncbi:MAG: Gfo/Idh/MocA family oxidoreductase, partial [Acidobacteriota bacterium]|nr:Gfo/Idh/MocA family oxidoreductase [Acidobacteriota bacterium]
MNNSRKTSRREFVTLAAATTLVAGQSAGVLSSAKAHIIAPNTLPQGSVSPNSKIRLATIGHGIIGRIDTLTALQVPGVEMVAVADIYDGRFVRAKELYGKSIFTTRDYKEILVRPDIDAVIVSTPDHWHARIAVDALNAGKHVYCEKPMVYAIDEGKRIIEAQRKTGKVLQVGSQFASSIVYRRAKELLASGAIGELNMVEAWWNRNNALGAWQYYIPPDASPQTIDWNRFLGSAPKRPFEPIRLFRWRNYRDYGTAVAGDLFVHLFTGINYITNSMGPTRIVSLGGLRYWKDGRDVPDMMVGIYDYPQTSAHPAFNLQLSVNFMS